MAIPHPHWPIHTNTRMHTSFHQVMQLAAFPFDAQTLQLSLRLPRRIDCGRSFVQFRALRTAPNPAINRDLSLLTSQLLTRILEPYHSPWQTPRSVRRWR